MTDLRIATISRVLKKVSRSPNLSMIPYFTINPLHIGPLTLYPWGFFVALGCFVGAMVGAYYLRSRQQNSDMLWNMLPWIMVVGFVGGRLAHIFFYAWPYYREHPLEIFAITHGGMSSTGVLVASLAFLFFWIKKHVPTAASRRIFLDALAIAFALGEAIGRIGCFVLHEHPGRVTTFLLGAQFPDGLVRHDLGLYLSLNGFVLFGLLLCIQRRKPAAGILFASGILYYAVTRFWLDALRVYDARYFGLTPAQYFCIGLCLFGFFYIVRLKMSVVDK
jgi:phosphatidylglycerol:prolipoprotein diacylglycerol transferase